MTRTLPNKTILCTFGSGWRRSVVRPKEGLCDIIFWDFFYKSARGSFLDRSSVGLQWFLEFARNDSGTTQFGIGINYGNALGAYDDLNKALGMNTFRDLWNMNIRHYGLLKFQVHDYFVTQRSTVQDCDKLLKRLRELQEVNRAGDVMKFGYIILGVGLFAPRNGQVYDYLEELLRYANCMYSRCCLEINLLKQTALAHVTNGDEDGIVKPDQPDAMTSSLGKLAEFCQDTGNIDIYLEKFEQFSSANRIDTSKKLPVFLTVLGEKTYVTLRSLLLPKTPTEVKYEDSAKVLQQHYAPKPSVVT
ncbi:uncharacterized protein LOC115316168 [Ixodes scapularis]|uniref:uncharacterized protein LOC115316168 n=1 Tax=Ixodes scapularis TaxID=6945 RepID=UPI001A9DF532|nr:uncharacterized protein LOC115316168 [Ixodes scapularis]